MRSSVAGFSTTAASIGPCCTRSFAISTSFWTAGPCGNTNAFAGTVAGRSIGLATWLVESPGYSPIGVFWAYGQRLDDGSRMSGDVQVRFCERLGVQLPRATHQNIYVRSARAGHRVMASLTLFITTRLK